MTVHPHWWSVNAHKNLHSKLNFVASVVSLFCCFKLLWLPPEFIHMLLKTEEQQNTVFVSAAAQWKEPPFYYLRVLLPHSEAPVDQDEDSISWEGYFTLVRDILDRASFCFWRTPQSSVYFPISSVTALPPWAMEMLYCWQLWITKWPEV